MAAYEILLLNTAIPQIQAAQAGDTYVVPRDIAFSAALTLSAGTANGVPYLNGSKVVTTGSALTFDGTNFATTGTITSGGSYNFNTTAGRDILWGTGSYTYITGNPGTGVMAFGIANSEQMRLTSTGLGIGTSSPAYKLDVFSGTNNSAIAKFTGAQSAKGLVVSTYSSNGNDGGANLASTDSMSFSTASIERMRLDSSGNLGLGVTPSAWRTSEYKAMQIGVGASFYGRVTAGDQDKAGFAANAFFDQTDNRWEYIATDSASRFEQIGGGHYWYTAPSGTAGNAITFTQAMTLDADGDLGIGTSSPAYKLDVAWNDGSTTRARLKNSSSSSAAVTLFEIANNADNSLQIGQRSSAASDANESFIQNNSGGLLTLSTLGSTAIRFNTNDNERARITSGGLFQVSSGGSVQVGGTAARATTAGTNRLDIFNGTAPVGTLTDGISIYSSSGEAYVMDAAGNATLFSPHDAETNEWIFKSKHTPTGKVLKIDVERLLKFVNDHFGLDAVHEFVEE